MEKNYRSLGIAVFIYVFLASGTFLPAFFEGWGWPEAINAALWLLHVAAGFGLIRGNEWGRVLILSVTGGSLLAMLVIFAFRSEAIYSSLAMVLFFGGVPTIILLAWALIIGSPAFKEDEKPPDTQKMEVPTPAKVAEVLPSTGHLSKASLSQRILHPRDQCVEINYRSLGFAVFVYAFVASGTVLPAFFEGWDWPEAINAALWLLHIAAGFGLIRGNEWGRVLILSVTGGSLLAMLVIFAFRSEATYSSLSMVLFFGGVPTIILLAWALIIGSPAFKEDEKSPDTQKMEVPTPAKVAEVSPQSEHLRKPILSWRTRHNLAYISYIVLGLISLWTAPLEPEPNVIGLLVLIPFGIPLLLALVFGPGISLVLWRDYRLGALTMVTIGVMVALTIQDTWSAFLIPYGTICTAIGIIWFTRYRKYL